MRSEGGAAWDEWCMAQGTGFVLVTRASDWSAKTPFHTQRYIIRIARNLHAANGQLEISHGAVLARRGGGAVVHNTVLGQPVRSCPALIVLVLRRSGPCRKRARTFSELVTKMISENATRARVSSQPSSSSPDRPGSSALGTLIRSVKSPDWSSLISLSRREEWPATYSGVNGIIS